MLSIYQSMFLLEHIGELFSFRVQVRLALQPRAVARIMSELTYREYQHLPISGFSCPVKCSQCHRCSVRCACSLAAPDCRLMELRTA